MKGDEKNKKVEMWLLQRLVYLKQFNDVEAFVDLKR